MRGKAARRLTAHTPAGQIEKPLRAAAKPLPLAPMTSEIQAAADAPQPTATISPSLFAFAIFYGGMVCIAGVLGNKQVALGPLAVEAGIFAFLMLVVTSSAVAELHGRATANKLVLIGFVPLLASLALTLLVLAVPASPDMDPARLSAFETIMGGTPRIWIAGILAYGTSQFLNVTIFSRLKGNEGSKLLWFRSAVASVLSQIVDTLIFISVAFYGVFPITELLLGQMLAKVVLSIILVPTLIYVFVAIGRRMDSSPTA
jgi:uncharacterized integral membrane protein (TIGR00697 family)